MDLFGQIRRRVFLFQVLLLLICSCALAFGTLRVFERDLRPEMTRKGDLIAASLARQFQRAVELGDRFSSIRGVEHLFRALREQNPEIEFIAAVDSDGIKVFYNGKPEKSVALEALTAHDLALARLKLTPSLGGPSELEELQRGRFQISEEPIVSHDRDVGRVIVGIDTRYVQNHMSELFYDILVVLVVSLLVTFELLLLIMSKAAAPIAALQKRLSLAVVGELPAHNTDRGWSDEVRVAATSIRAIVVQLNERYAALAASVRTLPAAPQVRQAMEQTSAALSTLGQAWRDQDTRSSGQQKLVGIRMPLFIFFLAEELSRSFFPIYARELYTPIAGLSPEIMISLPMMLFMLIVALSQPLGGPWVDRLGSRRLMVFGAVIGAAGLALTAMAESFWTLIIWRLITAAGYGIVFVAGQSYVTSNTTAGNRAWGLAMFVGSVLAASICGPAIGGILADRIGYRLTFTVGAALALVSAVLAFKVLEAPGERSSSAARPLRLHDVGVVLRNPRFLALVGLGAMPAKIILTGFLYYLAPLYLSELGNNPSAAGRIMMLYGLMMVLLTPIAARLADRVGHPLAFVSLGGAVSGLGAIGIFAAPSTEMMIVAIILLGIAQAISITPQLALVPTACPTECKEIGQATVLGFFRLFERIGSALGPIIAAFLLNQFGFVPSIVAIGCGVAGGCLLLPLLWRETSTDTPPGVGAVGAR